MQSDCAFYIGTTHKVCQDYAISCEGSVAISDGCSGSLNSDIGSRVLSITAMNKMAEIESLYNFDAGECILLARPSIKMLNISNQCLDATLLAAKVYNHGAMAMCYGDGVIAIKTKAGKTIIINCEYTDNYPFYINYLYDQNGRYSNWIANHNKKNVTQIVLDEEGNILFNEKTSDITRLFEEIGGLIRNSENKTVVEIIDEKEIEYIAVMSDGIHSFYKTVITDFSKHNDSIGFIHVLQEFLSFKSYGKNFVQKRINKFRKNCIKKKWGNADDVSLAVIHT